MSGIFGLVDSQRRLDVRALTDKMAASMSHREWFVAESFVDPDGNVAMGRLGIGIFNKQPQPVWNATQTIALVMAGEFYNQDALIGQGEVNGSDEQLALALYEQWGDDFASRLKAAFIIAIWDKVRQRLVITNDRFGLYPLFYTHYAGRLIFAPEMKGILADETFSRKLNLTALAQYMRFQHLLGETTFFENISLLPNASCLVYDLVENSYTIKPYWTFADIPYRPEVSFAEAVSEAGRLMRRAVQRLSGDAYRPGVYLSGGLDSRTILGLIERRPVTSITYGVRDCRDVYYAAQIAKKVGSNHYWFDLPNGEWIKEYADFHLNITEGFHSWIHAHGISTLAQARQLIDVNLTGWDGGTVMGHPESIEPLQVAAVDDLAFITRSFDMFTQKWTWPSITEAEEKFLYCGLHHKQMQGLAFDSFRTEISDYLNYRPDVRSDYFYINNHCRRLTQNLVTFTRSHIEVRFPFFDYDLFDFLYSLPAEVRGHRKLYRALIQQETPQLAYIPYDQDDFLPTTQPLLRNSHALMTRFKYFLHRKFPTTFPARPTLYADYENYLRHEVREWAENILFDPRTAERDIFNPAFLRTLMNRHLSNQEYWTIGKIAPIITYEMMLRRFFDASPEQRDYSEVTL